MPYPYPPRSPLDGLANQGDGMNVDPSMVAIPGMGAPPPQPRMFQPGSNVAIPGSALLDSSDTDPTTPGGQVTTHPDFLNRLRDIRAKKEAEDHALMYGNAGDPATASRFATSAAMSQDDINANPLNNPADAAARAAGFRDSTDQAAYARQIAAKAAASAQAYQGAQTTDVESQARQRGELAAQTARQADLDQAKLQMAQEETRRKGWETTHPVISPQDQKAMEDELTKLQNSISGFWNKRMTTPASLAETQARIKYLQDRLAAGRAGYPGDQPPTGAAAAPTAAPGSGAGYALHPDYALPNFLGLKSTPGAAPPATVPPAAQSLTPGKGWSDPATGEVWTKDAGGTFHKRLPTGDWVTVTR